MLECSATLSPYVCLQHQASQLLIERIIETKHYTSIYDASKVKIPVILYMAVEPESLAFVSVVQTGTKICPAVCLFGLWARLSLLEMGIIHCRLSN